MEIEFTEKIKKRVFNKMGYYWPGTYVKLNVNPDTIEDLEPGEGSYVQFNDISNLEIAERSKSPLNIPNNKDGNTVSNIYEMCVSSESDCQFDKPLYLMISHNNYNCEIMYLNYLDKTSTRPHTTCGFYSKDAIKSSKIKPIKDDVFHQLNLNEDELNYYFNLEMFREYGFQYILEASKVYLQNTINSAIMNKRFNEGYDKDSMYRGYAVPYSNSINKWFVDKRRKLKKQEAEGEISLENQKVLYFIDSLIKLTCVPEARHQYEPDFDKIKTAVEMLKFHCESELGEKVEFEKSKAFDFYNVKTSQKEKEEHIHPYFTK